MPQNSLQAVYEAASSFLRITGLVNPPREWLRDVKAGDARRGPWKAGAYVKTEPTWSRPGSCLYVVRASDNGFRYVGVSNKGVQQRWREAPALDPVSQRQFDEPQIFHRPCWTNIQKEIELGVSSFFEVRAIFGPELRAAIRLSAMATLGHLLVLPDPALVNESEV